MPRQLAEGSVGKLPLLARSACSLATEVCSGLRQFLRGQHKRQTCTCSLVSSSSGLPEGGSHGTSHQLVTLAIGHQALHELAKTGTPAGSSGPPSPAPPSQADVSGKPTEPFPALVPRTFLVLRGRKATSVPGGSISGLWGVSVLLGTVIHRSG